MNREEGEERKNVEVRAIMMGIYGRGRDRFGVSCPVEPVDGIHKRETITFSLVDWEGRLEPLKGQIVILSEVERFTKGWRARRARPVVLTTAGRNKNEE